MYKPPSVSIVAPNMAGPSIPALIVAPKVSNGKIIKIITTIFFIYIIPPFQSIIFL
jgi:hypothetical protein